MTREEHLKFCKKCENKEFDSQKGIICGLTGEIANFEDTCINFKGDAFLEESQGYEGAGGESGSKIGDIVSLFVPKQGYLSTPIIVYICTFVFFIMVISGVHIFQPDTESLIKWGANFKPLVLTGQVWRLITNCFLHIGLLHLLFNMYALIFIGLLLEPIIGKTRIWIAFLITGIGGSAASFWWHDLVVSAGASGAIFGLYGVYLALLLTNIIDKESKNKILSSLIFFVGYNLLYGMKAGIDNAAHIGGLVSGVAYGFSLFPSLSNKSDKTKGFLINFSSIAFIVLLTAFIIVKAPNTFAEYDDLMSEFIELEQEAVGIFNMLPQTSEKVILSTIQTKGIPNWKRCREIIKQADSIDNLPIELYERNKLLKRYCEYRIDSYTLMEKSLLENSNYYNYRIEKYNEKIELIIKKLQGESIPDSLLNIEPFKDITSDFSDEILFVVDGYPTNNPQQISPDEVQSVQVIKDDVAKQIYGERGKNGAVLITTKAQDQH